MEQRAPLKEIRLLLPVWGRRYVRQFLDVGLPSLLADGNIPALAAVARVSFVLLTRQRDLEALDNDPAWARLQRHANVIVEPIDDLVSDASSAALTLAYARGLRNAPGRLSDICFLFLVADYVVADGALRAAVAPVLAGFGAVLAGNLQASAEAMLPLLRQSKSAAGDVLSIRPRELVGHTLAHLHPANADSFPDSGAGPAARTNRLFWRAGTDGLVARTYLLHMIAIRPEVETFILAAPSDYAFVPELCPSGNVATLTDSDTYLAVEVQPVANVPRATGPKLGRTDYAAAVQSWATGQHRSNARQPLIFSANERFDSAPLVAASGRYVSEIEQAFVLPPQPHRQHPYWERMLEHHCATSASPVDHIELARLMGYAPALTARGELRAGRLRRAVLGRAPHVRPWHPRWADLLQLRRAVAAARRARTTGAARLAIVGRLPASAVALLSGGVSVTMIDPADLDGDALPAGAPFDVCLIMLPAGGAAPGVLSAVGRLVRPEGRVVAAVGEVMHDTASLVAGAGDLAAEGLSVVDIRAVGAGPIRLSVQRRMIRLAQASATGRHRVLRLAGAAGLAGFSLACNIAALFAVDGAARSSVVVTLAPSGRRRSQTAGAVPAAVGPVPTEAARSL